MPCAWLAKATQHGGRAGLAWCSEAQWMCSADDVIAPAVGLQGLLLLSAGICTQGATPGKGCC